MALVPVDMLKHPGEVPILHQEGVHNSDLPVRDPHPDSQEVVNLLRGEFLLDLQEVDNLEDLEEAPQDSLEEGPQDRQEVVPQDPLPEAPRWDLQVEDREDPLVHWDQAVDPLVHLDLQVEDHPVVDPLVHQDHQVVEVEVADPQVPYQSQHLPHNSR